MDILKILLVIILIIVIINTLDISNYLLIKNIKSCYFEITTNIKNKVNNIFEYYIIKLYNNIDKKYDKDLYNYKNTINKTYDNDMFNYNYKNDEKSNFSSDLFPLNIDSLI